MSFLMALSRVPGISKTNFAPSGSNSIMHWFGKGCSVKAIQLLVSWGPYTLGVTCCVGCTRWAMGHCAAGCMETSPRLLHAFTWAFPQCLEHHPHCFCMWVHGHDFLPHRHSCPPVPSPHLFAPCGHDLLCCMAPIRSWPVQPGLTLISLCCITLGGGRKRKLEEEEDPGNSGCCCNPSDGRRGGWVRAWCMWFAGHQLDNPALHLFCTPFQKEASDEKTDFCSNATWAAQATMRKANNNWLHLGVTVLTEDKTQGLHAVKNLFLPCTTEEVDAASQCVCSFLSM